jgi:NAD(P)-dependent dehydrogenase (short-subunit alcohol dehydrogenase family)
MTDPAGKVALVTGGGSGIGRGIVLALADEGASVVVVDLLEERARDVAAEVEKAGGTAVPLVCDVSQRSEVKKLKAAANEALGPVSLLFANAGVTWFDKLTDMKDEDVDWVIHVNLMGSLYCVQEFLPDMIAAGEGHVVATASNAGLIPGWVPAHTPYSISKAGMIAMMLNLRQELEGTGVGSTVYCPGGVRGRIAESYAHRPEHFGGPIDQPLNLDPTWSRENIVGSLEAEEVGPWILRAVRENAPIALDHANQRQHFLDHYVNHALKAFDEAEAWEATLPGLRAQAKR